jgi:hypothetical protein
MSDQALLLLGYFARIQGEIELLVQVRLRAVPDVRDGLGAAYFEQVTDGTRRRWLKALGTDKVDATLGQRLESVYAEVAEVRNHIAHAPINVKPQAIDDPGDIKVSAWDRRTKPLPSETEIEGALERLGWIDSWLLWLYAQQERGELWQKVEGEWAIQNPGQPPRVPPTSSNGQPRTPGTSNAPDPHPQGPSSATDSEGN